MTSYLQSAIVASLLSASLLAPRVAVGDAPGGAPDSEPVMGEPCAMGTAWPVAAGYAVTNHHLVLDRENVTLRDTAGREFVAWVIARDEGADLALLTVEDAGSFPPALPLAPIDAGLGAEVFTIGFPLIDFMGKTPKMSCGIISAANGVGDDTRSYLISTPIHPGNSGGPLLNMRGEVVGVVTAMVGSVAVSGDVRPIPGVNCASKVGILRELLALAPPAEFPLPELSREPANLAQLAERIQGSVLIVEAR